ncbi:MAG: hypothetical protein GKR92_03760 [Gammaproteobacteria bacterium]|nr:MAG: hypothetical protein GKR92_03760 [Gammaproteobacteria bacterium]
MPLIPSFITYWRKIFGVYLCKSMLCLECLALVVPLYSCGALSWHSIEQTPATPIAYVRDGVFVSGDYVRSALIAEIDGKKVVKPSNNLVEVAVGKHQIKVFCDEAQGEFNSEEFSGKAKTLEFEAQIQRTYLVRCVPFSHWWIEDLESKAVIAGQKF